MESILLKMLAGKVAKGTLKILVRVVLNACERKAKETEEQWDDDLVEQFKEFVEKL